MVKRTLFLLALCALIFARPATAAPASAGGEWIILVGGPSLQEWEKYKTYPHDHWWANFVRAARIRTEQIREQYGENVPITWLVYKQGYIDRGQQEKQDLLTYIDSVRDKFHLKLIYFKKGNEVIDYLNNGQPRSQMKVAGFEYFGHSNSKCFMFDYSSNVDSSAKSWLHEDELKQIDRRDFTRDAFAKAWGCHTAESMSAKWRAATGTKMIGAIGKTQYMMEELPILAAPSDKWAY